MSFAPGWFVVALAFAGSGGPALGAQSAQDVEAIRSAAFASTAAAELLRELCDRVGPRLTGSPGHALAVEHVAAKLAAVGLRTTRDRESIAHAWQRGPVRARITAPIQRELAAAAAPWTPGFAEPRALRVVTRAPAKDDAVLVDPRQFPIGPRRAHPFAAAGAVLVDSARPRALLATGAATFAAPFVPAAVPAVFVTAEDAALLRRLLDAGDDVTIELSGGGTVLGETAVEELVAALPGATGDGELVLAFCGLDSLDLGTGATADGAGAAVLVEAARILASLGRPPARTIRFAFLAGTAQGAGSSLYAKRRAAELPRHRLAFGIEGGAGRLLGLMLDGDRAELERMESFFAPLRDFGATDVGYRAPRTALTRALRDAGVPAFAFVQEAPEWGIVDGTAADTFDKVLARDLQEASCVLATVLWAAANER
ncbi:MAG: M28 family peptidase [Planctomycetes bacterium]|nr:M28 family peptidase [Planctomycetota bacterium]